MDSTYKIALVLTFNVIAFAAGMSMRSQPVQAAQAQTHVVNGLTLTDDQFNQQLAAQKTANDKMDQDYAVTLSQEQAANDRKMNDLVSALAKKAQKNPSLWVASPIKPTRSL
jgi:hypothetical protein